MSWNPEWIQQADGSWTWEASYCTFTVMPHPDRPGKWIARNQANFNETRDCLDDARRVCQDQDRRMRM